MPNTAVFIFDSSYLSSDAALPIDEKKPHVVVSNRRIEAPPGHSCLQLDRVTSLASIVRNFRLLQAAWDNAGGGRCIVIAPPGARSEQLLLNTMYALTLSRDVVIFDGLGCHRILKVWKKLSRAAWAGPARCLLGGVALWLKSFLFNCRVRALPQHSTREGHLFGLHTDARSFSLPLDDVILEEDGESLYGKSTRGWYMPAFSNRRQRYTVETTRHCLRDVTLHVEKIDGLEVSSLFKNGRILDYPYLLNKARPRYNYPVSTRGEIKTADRGINLLAYTSTYYHWLVEGVPRILDVIDDGFDFDQYPLVLPPLESYQRELLEVLGIDPDRQVVTVDMGDWCHVGECIFPTAHFPFGEPELEDPSGQPSGAVLSHLRERLMGRLGLSTTADAGTSRNIYISRARASRRKFTTETEASVAAVLDSAGFEKVCLEGLTWPAQVRLMAGVKLVAGLHGAGLTNILFTTAKALLEFHNPLEARPYFAVMARELHIDYTYIMGSLNGQSRKFDNITIDLRVVEKMAKELEAKYSCQRASPFAR
jgi:capsular polysaccharide biosynthesis protein